MIDGERSQVDPTVVEADVTQLPRFASIHDSGRAIELRTVHCADAALFEVLLLDLDNKIKGELGRLIDDGALVNVSRWSQCQKIVSLPC